MSLPTCPWCGMHDRVVEVSSAHGRFYCGCGSLFTGSDTEWRRLAQHRREAIERRAKSTHHVIEESE